MFEGLGAWSALGDDACPITSIHISDRGHFGAARLTAADAGTAALGYVVPARRLGAALAGRLDALDGVDMICPATAEHLERSDGAVVVTLVDGRRLEAPLVVLADGGRSTLGTEAGLALPLRHYPHKALVAVVGIDRDHGHRAFERFTEHGPLALLPVTGRRMAVAWTLPEEEAETLRTAADEVFLAALETASATAPGASSASASGACIRCRSAGWHGRPPLAWSRSATPPTSSTRWPAGLQPGPSGRGRARRPAGRRLARRRGYRRRCAAGSVHGLARGTDPARERVHRRADLALHQPRARPAARTGTRRRGSAAPAAALFPGPHHGARRPPAAPCPRPRPGTPPRPVP
ncbi:MAG: hypothetical protein M5U09_08150 [Gammaproteobacteria bacterium]|nr:hypothetical protein [Gammaproteobacteria bacterium]